MGINIWWALFFMFLGGLVVEVFETHAWRRYQQGKREAKCLPHVGAMDGPVPPLQRR